MSDESIDIEPTMQEMTIQTSGFSITTGKMSALDEKREKNKKRIAVLASGRGTDFQAIVDASESGEVHLNIALLICNNSDAYVIDRAKEHSIPYVVIDHRNRKRQEFDKEIDDLLRKENIDLVVLAGFMRILSRWFVVRWRDRIINIHPSLLPSFPGAHAHRDALEYGVKVTGLTIHFVDEEVDHGPIIFQYPVMIFDDDDEESLSGRILKEEHKWYPRIIQWIVDGRVKRDGRKVRVDK
ncbi:MAG: phosphoribosylglycinamide formyltransferase [Thermoplasmatota archaeon]